MNLYSTDNLSASQRRRREALSIRRHLQHLNADELIGIVRDKTHRTLLMRCIALRCLIWLAPQDGIAACTFPVRRRLTRWYFGV